MGELKPCPFCGGKPSKEIDDFGIWHIRCMGCVANAFVISNDEKDAAEKWNTRMEG